MTEKALQLLADYPYYEKLAMGTETIREVIDKIMEDHLGDAFDMLIVVDTNMLELLDYHMQLSTELLKAIPTTK